MRTYGRVRNQDGTMSWVVVATDDKGYNDSVYLTSLVQALKLNLNESPFYADWGIPAKPSVVQQIFPDFYVSKTQQRFAPHFSSLSVKKIPANDPTYNLSVVTTRGFKIEGTVAT